MAEIALADWIKRLRQELEDATKDGQGSDVRFRVGPVELELEIVTSVEAGGKGGLKLWVADLEASATRTSGSTQRLKLVLQPEGPDAKQLTIADQPDAPPG